MTDKDYEYLLQQQAAASSALAYQHNIPSNPHGTQMTYGTSSYLASLGLSQGGMNYPGTQYSQLSLTSPTTATNMVFPSWRTASHVPRANGYSAMTQHSINYMGGGFTQTPSTSTGHFYPLTMNRNKVAHSSPGNPHLGNTASIGSVNGPLSPKHSSRTASGPHHHAKMAAVAAASQRSQYLSTKDGSESVNTITSSVQGGGDYVTEGSNEDEGDGSKWTALDIGGMGIRQLSKTLFSFTFLATLYLNHNNLTNIPSAISQLTQLKVLHLSSNRLKTLPPELGKCMKLVELLLYDNLLTSLPYEFGALYQLKNLGLDGNIWADPFHSLIHKEGSLSVIIFLREHGPPPTLPPDRLWIPISSEMEAKEVDTFTLFDYNILSNNYTDASYYGYSPSWCLSWDYRKELIMQEINSTNADIICLQEVEGGHYDEFFIPRLKDRYESVYIQKSRSRTMTELEKKMVDGCAIFYKPEKFKLEESYKLEFSQLAISKLAPSDIVYNRLMNRDNVAIIGRFSLPGSHRQLLVANTHIHWDPAYKDVKIIQTLLLIEELNQLRIKYPECAIIVTGDFNSTPTSAVYSYLAEGTLESNHSDFSGLTYEPLTSQTSSHGLCLKDVYDSLSSFNANNAWSASKTFTNYTGNFQGILDYIWYGTSLLPPTPDSSLSTHRNNSLTLTGVLSLLPKEYYLKISGALPNPHIPSDHLSLMAEFKFT